MPENSPDRKQNKERKLRRAEAGNPPTPPPSSLPASLPRSLPRLPSPPSSLRPSSLVFVSSLCNREVEAEGGRAARPGGAEVRRRCSLAGRAAFIMSQEVNFIFTSPRRGRGSNKRLLLSLWFAHRGAHTGRAHTAVGKGRGSPEVTGRKKLVAVGEEKRYLTVHPKSYLKVGKGEEEGFAGSRRALVNQLLGQVSWCLEPLFSE